MNYPAIRIEGQIFSGGLSSGQLFAYFRESSHRFWSKVGRAYPEATPIC